MTKQIASASEWKKIEDLFLAVADLPLPDARSFWTELVRIPASGQKLRLC